MLSNLANLIRDSLKRMGVIKEDNDSLIKIYISKSAILHNLNEFRKLAPQGNVAPVLKSNAYGHGLILVAKILEKEDVPFFIVDSVFEAKTLRKSGIKKPILVIGYSKTETILNNKLKDVRFTITSLDTLRELHDANKTAQEQRVKNNEKESPFAAKIGPKMIHLKIDTGMNRQGIRPDEVEAALSLIEGNSSVALEGICSHFADSDNSKNSSVANKFTDAQIKIWNDIVERIQPQSGIPNSRFPDLHYFHISATYGHRYDQKIVANLSRLGLGLYGIAEKIEKDRNKKFNFVPDQIPALKMTSIISSVKNIKKGDLVGYGVTFKANKDMRIALIPVGYFEGLDRELSNKGSLKIESPSDVTWERFAPLVGRISMNISAIDVTDIPEVKKDSEVTVISDVTNDKNSIINMARDVETIPYVISVHIPQHLKRILVD